MTLIRIVPAAVRAAGVGAVQGADTLQAQAGELRALPLPAMPAAMTAKYEAALDEVAARLVGASSQLGPAGVELQIRAAAADTTDMSGGVRSGNAGASLARSLETKVVLPGGQSGMAQIRATAKGDVASATVPSAALSRTLAPLWDGSASTTPASQARGDEDQKTANKTARHDVRHGEEVGGRPAAAVQQALAAPAGGSGGGGSGGGGFSGGGGTSSGSVLLGGDTPDASAPSDGQHRAEATGGAAPAVPGEDATRQDWACWMAASASEAGLPPSLPVMAALVQSDLQNAPGAGASGLFGFDPATTKAPSGHGAVGVQPADWWSANPTAQLDVFMRRALRMTADGDASMTDHSALGQWAAVATPGGDAEVMTGAAINAGELVDGCEGTTGARAGAGGGSGAGALGVAQAQLGVQEVGTNGGEKVDGYLASAGVGSGNPWCASFVHWSMEQAGQEIPGQGWAAVATWVDAAQNGDHGLSFVDAADARPGDIVAYDWGGDSNFGSDGHIGFLESEVVDGRFTAVEGNAEDAVSRMERSTGVGNVVFIRPGG